MQARLTCSIKEFNTFIGPKIRNEIKILTKREKRRIGNVCQECGKEAELESAHFTGNNRLMIINDVLARYVIDEQEQIIQVNLSEVVKEIIAAIAGLIDGEGSFVLRETGRKHLRFSPLISLGMSHKNTVQFVADTFKVGPLGKVARKKPRKDLFTIRVTTEKEIEQICQALRDYSITKLDQIQLLLKYFELKEEQATIATADDVSQSRKIWVEMINVYIKLRKANQRGQPPDYDAMKEKLLNKIP